MTYDYDLFVIGAGSGGVRASRMAAAKGARVAVAEERPLGGTCVNVGCIPKKLLVYASHYRDEVLDARAGYGWDADLPDFDWPTLIRNKNKEIERLNGIYGSLLENAGATLHRGRARLMGPHEIEVAGKTWSAAHILIATGSWPFVPDIPGSDLGITSNDAFFLDALPERVLVVGGGYIGVEFAGIWHGLGSQVTQLYRGDLFLRGFDGDLRRALAEQMRERGVDLRFNCNVRALQKSDEGIRAELTDGSELVVDQVLFATGRRALTEGLGLDAAGVDVDDTGAVPIDATLRTNQPHIYSLGDVSAHSRSMDLTPVALHEAMCLVETLFGSGPSEPDYDNVPCAVFSQPSLGCVGLSEEEARARGHDVVIFRSNFRALKHTLTGRTEKTLMKLVVDRPSDRVLGVHMMGPEAGEIIQGFAVALRCGATKAQFDSTIGVHPTSAEELVTLREPVAD